MFAKVFLLFPKKKSIMCTKHCSTILLEKELLDLFQTSKSKLNLKYKLKLASDKHLKVCIAIYSRYMKIMGKQMFQEIEE